MFVVCSDQVCGSVLKICQLLLHLVFSTEGFGLVVLVT